MSFDEVLHAQSCTNCGATLSGPFCAVCGQSSKRSSRSLKSLVGDFLDTYFGYDGKVFRTLVYLLFKPNFLTEAYLSGQRIRFVNPVRLYLVISVIFFLITSQAAIDLRINPTAVDIEADPLTLEDKSLKDKQDKDQAIEDAVNIDLPFLSKSKNESLTQQSRRSLHNIRQDIEQGRQGQVTEKFLSQLPQTFLILLPFFALLWYILLFMKRRFFIDHLIFSLHIHSMAFLCLLMGATIWNLNFPWLAAPFFAGIGVYLLVAVHRFAKTTWPKSFLLTGIVSIIYIPTCFLLSLGFALYSILTSYQ